MRKILLIVISVFLFTGCMQSTEYLTLNDDGSGTLEVNTFMPQGSIELVDIMFGSIVQGLQQAFESEADSKNFAQESIANQLLTKQDIIQKADKVNLEYEFKSFDRNVTDEGVHAQYTLAFKNIYKLMQSGILSANVKFKKETDNVWICEVKKNEKKANETQGQLQQFDSFKSSGEFDNLDENMQNIILSALSDLRFEFLVSMPIEISEYSGAFEKIDSTTARLYIGGNFLEDPSIIEKMSGQMTDETMVMWGVKEQYFVETDEESEIFDEEEFIEDDTLIEDEDQDLSHNIQVYLKDGSVKSGELIEETDDYIKILFSEMPLTFYREDIDHIE